MEEPTFPKQTRTRGREAVAVATARNLPKYKWCHFDGSPCFETIKEDPNKPDGGFWWCDLHGQAVGLNPNWKG